MLKTTVLQIALKRLFSFLFVLSLIALSTKANSVDSIYVGEYNKVRYFCSDTIFVNYAQKGFLPVIDDLYDYYEDIIRYMPADRQLQEIAKIQRIAEKYKSKELILETEFLNCFILSAKSDTEIQYKAQQMQKVVNKASDQKNTFVKLRAMEAIFDLYWSSSHYAKAFSQAYVIDKELQEVSEEQYPGKGSAYFKIGEAYYFFRDYDKAIPYLRKAMRPAKYYFDRSNLQSRNTIGLYYHLTGQVDSAEYYFRSAYFNTQKVKARSVFDAVALSNIGRSLFAKQKYDEAISYFQAGLGKMLQENNYELASDITVGLAQCYMNKHNLKKAKDMIDSSRIFIKRSHNIDLYQSLYPIMSGYYARTGNSELSSEYIDSTIYINKVSADKYNSLYILKAEQELFESQSRAKDEEIKLKEENYKNKLFYSFAAVLLISLGLVVVVILYRKNKKAYQALVLKNQDWAKEESYYDDYSSYKVSAETKEKEVEVEIENVVDDNNIVVKPNVVNAENGNGGEEPAKEDLELMKKVHELVAKEKIFKDLDLTLDSLAKQIDVNRNYLSKAINRATGKNFNTYINEYRVKEAIKILSTEKSDLISIDAIALEVGFNNRTSFYQSFKKITGLSPSDFRNNKSK